MIRHDQTWSDTIKLDLKIQKADFSLGFWLPNSEADFTF
jgi:hypothetical protein